VSPLLEATFPLVLSWDEDYRLTFVLRNGRHIRFEAGCYFLVGDNGSGKTSFLSMLSLTAGTLGPRGPDNPGSVRFMGTAYNERGFDAIRAAEIRERYYAIFPQKVFFLPVSSRDNYRILNGRDPAKAESFSENEYPHWLSGGEQQERLMEIVLDEDKPIWFLDEPLTHLDTERRLVFWRKLEKALQGGLRTVFLVDHWMAGAVRENSGFEKVNTLRAYAENRQRDQRSRLDFQTVDIYWMPDFIPYVRRQIRAVESEEKRTQEAEPTGIERELDAG